MIITLVGADFSDNNINNTLTSWTISNIVGTGATYDGPGSVEKNAALSATVTLDEGYEVGAAGVTVTMSGTTLESAFSQSGQVITISIESVTGAVMIKVPTKNTATGEEDGGNETPDAGGGDESITTTYLFKDQVFVGYLRGGNYVESAKSATTDYIDISSKPKIGYYGRMGFVSGDAFHALEFYDANKTYLADLSVLGTGSPMYTNIDLSDSKYANAKYVRASVSQSSYTQEQFESWYFVVGSFIDVSAG